MHFVVGIPDVESVHDKAVREVIAAQLDSYDGGEKKMDKRLKVLTIYKDTVASQKNFHEWFRGCILSTCETQSLFYDDLYTIIGRYTCPKYSKVSRLGIPGLGTKRSSALITLFRLTDDQQKLLQDNARRQIIAGGFGTGKTLLLIEEAIKLVIGQNTDDKERNTKQRCGRKGKRKPQAKESGILSTNNTDRHPEMDANGSSTEMDHTLKNETQTQHEEIASKNPMKDHINPSFCFILSCSNVGENGFVFNDPDLLVEQLENHLRDRVRVRKEGIKDHIEIYKLDEVIQRSFPEEKSSQSNIACEMLTVDVLTKVIRDLVESKAGYTCHIMLDEFPSINLVNAFDWRSLQKLYDEYPQMRLWIALSAEGNMQTYLSCDSTLAIQKTLGVPRDFAFGFLQESKRMTPNVYKLMERTQEYEGKTKREHFRCGIEIEDHIPMWIPMPRCSCDGIERGFFECTCMCDRLKISLREIFKRISHFGNDNVFILLHIVMFESLREKLVDIWTKALREIKVGCRVEIPKLEHFSFTIDGDESNKNHSVNDSKQVTLIHNRYFHGCEGKVMVVFPPLGGPQFQPHQEGLSLAIPFDNVVARTVSRLFIVTPTEMGMIQYSKELCRYIEYERSQETNPAKNDKWDKFLSIFRHRKNLPSYLMKMEREGVLVKCPVGDLVVDDDESVPVVDTMQSLSITEAPITKWYMTPSQK
ncbi:hypothetical protein HOLleu_03473 [Holothuria leucospilota]|uniref:Uncharacterized protein n=1 Tax=Holothuria leucospilota TaxID=206669 RepID=A0A9Q1CSW0_HOLLE|nr:hypothetical protein HOLleu_03473 [Holothuria leucospilota]